MVIQAQCWYLYIIHFLRHTLFSSQIPRLSPPPPKKIFATSIILNMNNLLKKADVSLTSPSILNREDLPHPFGPHTKTLVPDVTSNVRLSMRMSPFGVTRGTSSNLIMLSWKIIRPDPGTKVRLILAENRGNHRMCSSDIEWIHMWSLLEKKIGEIPKILASHHQSVTCFHQMSIM